MLHPTLVLLREHTGARPSISLKKMMVGWQFLASLKRRQSWCSASLTHLERQLVPLRMKKAGWVGGEIRKA